MMLGSAGTPPCSPRVLVAGIGDPLLADDGFGPEVVRRVRQRPLPHSVAVLAAGAGARTLLRELGGGYDALILVDSTSRRGAPGTLYRIDSAPDGGEERLPLAGDPPLLGSAGLPAGWPGRLVLVGCERGPAAGGPRAVGSGGRGGGAGLGLSPPVARAVGPAVDLVLEAIQELTVG